jgi:anti-sigma factor RsiW
MREPCNIIGSGESHHRAVVDGGDSVPVCRDVSELVTGYLEQTLPLLTRLGIRWHLAQCPACRRYVAQMRQTIRLLGATSFPPPAPETESRMLGADPAPGD